MKINDFKNQANDFWPSVAMDRLGLGKGGLLSLLILSITVLLAFASLFSLLVDYGENTRFVYGAFFIFLSIELFIQMTFAFYSSHAYLDLEDIGSQNNVTNTLKITYEASHFILRPLEYDPVLSILSSPVGEMVFFRLGISANEVYTFLKNRVKPISINDLILKDDKENNVINLEKLAVALINIDQDFSLFLSSRRIKKEDFIGAVGWSEHISNIIRRRRHWWSRDNLGRIPGLGKSWSYGEVPTLSKHAVLIQNTPYYSEASNVLVTRKSEIESLERVLTRVRGANAILVAETEEEAMSVISALGFMISEGTSMPNLGHKQIFVLDYANLISSTKEKNLFEERLKSALRESVRAGDIILVIKNLPELFISAKNIGSDMMEILEWYLNSPLVHIIATTNNAGFHGSVESNDALLRYFEKILIKNMGLSSVLSYLRDEALRIESETKVWFLYQAVQEAAESAERYFFGSSLEDKATDLLIEAASSANSAGSKVVTRNDIIKVVESETGVPRETTEFSTDNKVLLSLEKILSERIVGQEEGVIAISNAMKRVHAGITNPNRPMGSFLFLGPTGVGKTETTKALADTFFGGESSIMRLDMSEYRTVDSLERLIGNFALGKPGILSSILRDKPYGVLLLDEFEKTSKEIHDLFLQVLDEGVFSDMSGKKVNARNLIIIATSNAGSSQIWKIVKEKGLSALSKEEIIAQIIDEGIFKPELINRFDGVVVFHPLDRTHLTKIATLMLLKFNKRLSEKGIEIEITPELVNALVEKGIDPSFGARPMNRAIQDKVETMVANKILMGQATPGTKIIFSPDELKQIRI